MIGVVEGADTVGWGGPVAGVAGFADDTAAVAAVAVASTVDVGAGGDTEPATAAGNCIFV